MKLAARLDELCQEIGRDPAEIRRSAQVRIDPTNPTRIIEDLNLYREAGFTELVIYCGGDDPIHAAEIAAATVLPQLRAARAA